MHMHVATLLQRNIFHGQFATLQMSSYLARSDSAITSNVSTVTTSKIMAQFSRRNWNLRMAPQRQAVGTE
jgi:hypothetical protein